MKVTKKEVLYSVMAPKNMDKWAVVVGGSARARKEWGATRYYASKASAQRRVKQIHEAHDPGVSTIWLLTPSKIGFRRKVN